MEKLYIGFIRPILEYGGIVWDNCSIHESDLLESVQPEAARIITGLRKGTSHVKLQGRIQEKNEFFAQNRDFSHEIPQELF